MTAAVLTLSPLDGLIPPERRDDAEAMLSQVLRGAPITGACSLTGGASGAAMIRIEADASVFVLRLDGLPDGLRDPARQYACQAIAAGRGLAPALLHSDAARRMSLSAFVRDASAQMTRADRLSAVAASVRRLHDGAVFPPLLPYLEAMGFVVDHFTAANLVPAAMGNEIAERFAQLSEAYPRVASDVVASHCDLNPGNILFEGGRALFVDWESAFAADRYVDVAAVLNYLAVDAADEDLILQTYFGRSPSLHERARADAMRQVNRLFYGTLLLVAAAGQGRRASAEDFAGATYARFRRAPVGVASAAGKIALGCGFLNDALTEMSHPLFREVLARVRS